VGINSSIAQTKRFTQSSATSNTGRKTTKWISYLQPRVQVSPRIMIVAVAVPVSPPDQHSPRLEHRASSQTVCIFSSRSLALMAAYLEPPGIVSFIHLGLASGRFRVPTSTMYAKSPSDGVSSCSLRRSSTRDGRPPGGRVPAWLRPGGARTVGGWWERGTGAAGVEVDKMEFVWCGRRREDPMKASPVFFLNQGIASWCMKTRAISEQAFSSLR
jgi:hypothetical protein